MTEAFFAMNDFDLRMRASSTGRTALADLVAVDEFVDPGVVFEDPRVTVTAARVPHPPIHQAYAFRFDGPDRSIVISGDTARSDELVAFARGADVLVHEVYYPPAIAQMAALDMRCATTLAEHIVACHTSVDEVGEIAAAAGVATLVLSHFVPGDASVPDEVWAERARRRFGGQVIVGRDLLEV
jgi:ribonuclease BN (tRNA processing enzyme)